MDSSKARIVFVEFTNDDGVLRPFNVGTTNQDGPTPRCDYYDVDWCRRDRCYYQHMSGCGWSPVSSGTYWAEEGLAVDEKDGAVRLAKLSRRWPMKKLAELIDSEETGVEYCDICQDYLPVETCCSPGLCRHLAWVVEVGTCGCGCVEFPQDQHRDDFVMLFKHLGIAAVRRLIEVLRRDAYEFDFDDCYGESIEQAVAVGDKEDDLRCYFEAVIGGFGHREHFPLAIVIACLWLGTLEAGVTREQAGWVIRWAEEWLLEFDDEEIKKWARWHVYRSFFHETGSYLGACSFA